MKKGETVSAILGFVMAFCGVGYLWKKKCPQFSLKQYTKICLYMVVLDDEICRNEWEGRFLEGKKIKFPSKADSLQDRYHLFLETYLSFTRAQMDDEVHQLEKRLSESRKRR